MTFLTRLYLAIPMIFRLLSLLNALVASRTVRRAELPPQQLGAG